MSALQGNNDVPTDDKSKLEAEGGAHAIIELPAVQDGEMGIMRTISADRRAVGWCLFLLVFGFDGLLTGSLPGVPAFKRHFGYFDEASGVWVIAAIWQSLWIAMTNVMMMFGALVVARMLPRFGIRVCLITTCVFSVGGIIGEQLCSTPVQFLGAKIIAGFSFGLQTALAIMSMANYAPQALRGTLGACLNTFILFGGWLAQGVLTGIGQAFPEDKKAYQIPFGLQYIFVAVLLVGAIFFPEAPAWHLARGDEPKAYAAICRLHGAERRQIVEREWQAALRAHEAAGAGNMQPPGAMEPFTGGRWKRTLIPIGILVFQQLVGATFVTSYLTYFYGIAGTGEDLSLTLGMMSFSVQVVGNLLSWYTVNRLGRRLTMLIGLGAMTVSLIIMGVTWAVRTAASLWVMVAFMTIWAFLYQWSIGACGYSIAAEACSARLRSLSIGYAQGFAQVAAWVMGFATPYMINPDEANLGGLVGFIFAVLCGLALVFVYFFIPEFAGRSMEEIDELFESGQPARRWSKPESPSGHAAPVA